MSNKVDVLAVMDDMIQMQKNAVVDFRTAELTAAHSAATWPPPVSAIRLRPTNLASRSRASKGGAA